ncbi:MAG: hypothetical protein BMS9Abin05_1290 [Rhodothermia bacterium]|nr:MAG: hypothetical protein BMS9Abin05_1290 [Rhodothermia bacterium]
METDTDLRWAAIIVWIVVNAVNLLQSAGFISRIVTGDMVFNHRVGYVIITLVIPSTISLIAFVRSGAGWLQWAGPASFLAFVVLMLSVDYVWVVEFRSPTRYNIVVPYLVLFFGSILLMGLPMFKLNRSLWLVTVTTTVFLLGSMVQALRKGIV